MRASDRAYAALLEDIQSGALAPGTVLAEIEQAARLGVSRTPLREALARLAATGLVTQLSPRVTVVADIDADDIRELFELRRALEETGARLCAERADRAVFAALADEFRDAETLAVHADARAVAEHADARALAAHAAADDYYALIARFDAALDAAVGNSYLVSALRTVRTHLVRVRRLARDNPARLRASAAEHRLIATAIAAGDADLAAHATHVHLYNALASALANAPRTPTTQGAA